MVKDFFDWICKSTVTQIADKSYYPCVIISMIALILYIGGLKKAGKAVPASMIIYFLLQCFKAAVK
ncbi:hypothetical protein [Clostridium beijerinckii]|uniref:hypothetical protein n=1 Tax=Clostridium beijerinckii TaxID=1520 RepID=UPI00098C8625|nr:hypothetical protein [Clostridium beijerinckii]NRT76263.1 hypothetical protein [Clostridium beijerinckii]OOM37165.1 hypothetical protein CBEIJ_50130 [Clostridium beijerinckii]